MASDPADGPDSAGAPPRLRYVDAGANLLDPMYRGTYHSKHRHDPDLDLVLRRAHANGVDEVVSLAGTVEESEGLMELIRGLDAEGGEDAGTGSGVRVFGTVGVHPTRCAEAFADRTESGGGGGEEEGAWTPKPEAERDEVVQRLIRLAEQGKESGDVVAVGECGLDYARLHFCPKEIQEIGLRAQLRVAREVGLPLYLHNRESGRDLHRILSEHRDALLAENAADGGGLRGIVHSFDEGIEVAERFLSLGLYIGINGCSLKTAENLDTVRQLPLERLILETDCPWCDIRPSHAGSEFVRTKFPSKKEKQYTRELGGEFCVKNRTEPCHVAQVAEVVAGVKGESVEEVVAVCRRNVYDLFGRLEKKRTR